MSHMLYDIFTHVSSSFFKCPQEKPGGAVAGKKTILQRTLLMQKNLCLLQRTISLQQMLTHQRFLAWGKKMFNDQ